MKINGSLVFDASAGSEIQNLRLQKVSSNPTFTAADTGRLIYNTTSGVMYIGVAGSTNAWVALATGGNAAALQSELDALEAALGGFIDGADGTFDASAFSAFTNVAAPTDLLDALTQLDAAISGKDALAELVDVQLGTLNDNDLLQYDSGSSKWVDVAIGSASGVQAHDAGLDALAAFNSNGILVQTAEDTFAARSIAVPAAGLSITNADGVAGNPTLALANGLASIESLATTGFVVQSAADTFITRDIVTASSGRITVSNGDGVAGSPTIDLATVTDSAAGTFKKITVDSYGRVTGTADVVAADITALVDSAYVNTSGDTMTGNLNMGGTNKVTGLAAPTVSSDAVNKAYADALVAGLSWKQAVRVASTADIDLATGGELTIDGVALDAGDRVLVKDQTATEENGIYIVATGAWVRSDDMNVAAEFDGSAVFVMEGTSQQGSGWTETATVTTLETDAVSFSQFTGGALYTWGTGLSNSGNTINVNLGAGIAQLPSDEVGIDLYSSTDALRLTTDGSTASTLTGAKLTLVLKSAGGLTQDTDGLYIPAAGVTNAMLANSTITLDADDVGSATVALGATLAVMGDSASGITTSIAAGGFKVAAVDATTTQKGVASFDASHFSVTAGAVSLAASLDDLSNVSSADAATTGDVLTKTAGDWQPVTRAALVGSTSIGDHNDVTLTSPADGEILVMDGTGQFVNQKAYHLYDGASATSHTVTHNLGQKYCNVTVVDATDEVVIPQSITFDSTSQLTVTFNTAIACKVVVMGIA